MIEKFAVFLKTATQSGQKFKHRKTAKLQCEANRMNSIEHILLQIGGVSEIMQ